MTEADVGFMPAWDHPIRIPDGVPLEHTDPPFAVAGEKGTWRAPLRLARDVPADAVLKLETASGRSNRPAFVDEQVTQADADGCLALWGGDGRRLGLSPDRQPGRYLVGVPEARLRAGETLTLMLGDRSGGGGGLTMPALRALDKFVLLYVATGVDDRPGVWNWTNGHQIVAACSLHILGGPIQQLRAYAPSQARPGEPFDVLVRPEDEFSNLSHEVLEGAEAFLGEERLAADSERVADSTCVHLRVSLGREGVHRLRIVGRPGGWEAVTNPVACAAQEAERSVFWGMIHGHTEMSDGRESLDRYFHQIRHEAALDFSATADHDHLHETSEQMWRGACRAVQEWHEPGEFVTFLGYEWAKWRQNGDGDRNVYYFHDDRPMFRSDDGEHPTPPDLFRAIEQEQALIIPHHTGHRGNWCDWKDHDPVRERLVEIYQIRGSYECAEADGNPLAEHYDKPPFERGYVRNALAVGWRVGFTGGGDDHTGHAGTDFPVRHGQARYTAGLTAVLAADRTRKAIWDALWNRRVIATSGPRILLDYTLNGHRLGAELSMAAEPELARLRRLRIRCDGMAPIECIEVIRNNRVVHSVSPDGALGCEAQWEDREPLQDIWLPPATFCKTPFCFYYVRVLQADGEMAWASPVWLEP